MTNTTTMSESRINRLNQYFKSCMDRWYENARLDYGIDGHFDGLEMVDHKTLKVHFTEQGENIVTTLIWPSEYTDEQLWNIWMEEGADE